MSSRRRVLDVKPIHNFTDIQTPSNTNNSNHSSNSDPSRLASNTVQFDSSSVAVTALVLLSAIFFLGFFSVYARRFFANDNDNFHRRHRHSSTPFTRRYFSSSGSNGLDPTAIKALPLVSYVQKCDSSSTDGLSCVVCLSEFEDGEIVKVIPCCEHLFHPQCIDSWLVARGSCPLCRSTELFGSNSKEVEVRVPAPAPAPNDEHVEVVVASGREEEEVREGTREELEEGGRRRGELGDSCSGEIGRSRSWCCLVVMDEKIELPRKSCSL